MAKGWALQSRPEAMPTLDNFTLVDIENRDLQDGEVRVKNSWLSVDPYMRGRMIDRKSYVPPFQIGEVMTGGAVGRVTESKAEGFATGDLVSHMAGWRDEAIVSGADMLQKLPETGMNDQIWLSHMGLTGATAWFGLLHVAEAKEGDIVFVSAAAGAVGSAVVQIAKARGMTVIGSAGGADKCTLVKELGADECLDYKASPIYEQLKAAAPKGINVYFDNVGADHLDAALATAQPFSRFAICGMIDIYNDFESGRTMDMRFMSSIIGNRIQLKGFIMSDFIASMSEFHQGMGALIAEGKVQARETVFDGLSKAPDAFIGLFSGKNTGKMLVKI